MTNRHLIDPIISFLEHRKLQGMQSIAISSENLAYIRETKSPTEEAAPAPKANTPSIEA
ncbi:MAG: hypothetical protein HRT89_04135, partial [Lentisphaeria bacterium]|nr:hypothetical protein [Lentisphaeria bacterium]